MDDRMPADLASLTLLVERSACRCAAAFIRGRSDGVPALPDGAAAARW